MRDLFEILATLPMPILLLLLAGVALRRRRRVSDTLLATATAALALLSLPLVGRALSWPLHAGAGGGATPPGELVVLVPTAGIFEDGTGRWWPGAESVRRAALGHALGIETGAPLLIVGGLGGDGRPSEAEVVAAALDLDGPDLLLDTGAADSRETARAVRRLLAGRAEGGAAPAVALVTSPAHFARMAASLRRQGLTVASARLTDAAPAERGWRDFVPSADGLAISRAAVHEYVAILFYLARGDFGPGDLGPVRR